MQKTKKEKKTSNGKKVALIVANVVFYIVIAIFYVCAIWGLVGRFSGTDTFSFFGYQMYVVATPSMSRINPEYADFLDGHNEQMQVGDLILIRSLPEDEALEVYDIVTFRMGGQTIVHRVVDVSADGQEIVTRGDANNNTDGTRTRDEFKGKFVANVGSTAGQIVGFVQSTYGVAAMAGCGFVVLGVNLILELIKRKEKTKTIEPPDEEPISYDSTVEEA